MAAWFAAGATMVSVIWAVDDYRRWRSLGPGGLPASPRGWLTTTWLRTRMRDPLAIAPLLARNGDDDDPARLLDLPPRPGARPRVAPHPVPHRQLDQHAPAAIMPVLEARFERAVAAGADRLIFARSHFETRHRAVTARARCCGDAVSSRGEVAHIHPSDGSMHMVLGRSDARAVVERGWGERHGLAGIALGLPLTYTLIYAPRSSADVAAIDRILTAAIAHMTCADGESVTGLALPGRTDHIDAAQPG